MAEVGVSHFQPGDDPLRQGFGPGTQDSALLRLLRNLAAALLLGGVIVWLLFGDHKGYALGAAVIVAFLCRFLVLDGDEVVDESGATTPSDDTR